MEREIIGVGEYGFQSCPSSFVYILLRNVSLNYLDSN